MTEKNALIQLENVWKIYQMGDVQVPALRGIDLSLSVANTGNNPAYSVTVRIPQQENFRVLLSAILIKETIPYTLKGLLWG